MAFCTDGMLMLFQVIAMVVCVIMYVVAFASADWVKDGTCNYGLWKYCNVTGDCYTISPSMYPGYYDGSRALACLLLISFTLAFVLIFIEDQPSDKGSKRTCYRYSNCCVTFFSVVLAVMLLVVFGGGVGNDEKTFKNPTLDWCFWLCLVATMCAAFSCYCRFRYIGRKHPHSCWACCACGDIPPRKTKPSERVGSARSNMDAPPAMNESVVSSEMLDSVSNVVPVDTPANGRSQLPPLSIMRKASSDSGLSSNVASRDSTREDQSQTRGRLSSLAVLNNHLAVHPHAHHYSSAGSSRSSSDSESSAELAPRVHTPTDKKRVGFSTALNVARYNLPPAARKDSAPRHSSNEDLLKDTNTEGQAPPIITLPVKMRGVELSRAATNAKTTAFLDNIKLMSKVVSKWRKSAHEMAVRRRSSLLEGIPEGLKQRRKSQQENGEAASQKRRKSQQDIAEEDETVDQHKLKSKQDNDGDVRQQRRKSKQDDDRAQSEHRRNAREDSKDERGQRRRTAKQGKPGSASEEKERRSMSVQPGSSPTSQVVPTLTDGALADRPLTDTGIGTEARHKSKKAKKDKKKKREKERIEKLPVDDVSNSNETRLCRDKQRRRKTDDFEKRLDNIDVIGIEETEDYDARMKKKKKERKEKKSKERSRSREGRDRQVPERYEKSRERKTNKRVTIQLS